MSPALILAFWGMAFAMIVLPGPDWAFVLASGTRDRTVVPAVAGLAVGYLLLTVVVAAGVGVLVAQNPLLLTVLTFAGAGYLIYLGLGALIARRKPPQAAAVTATASETSAASAVGLPWWNRMAKGIGVSGLNPKGVLVFVAVLPQFTSARGPWPIEMQLILLGLVFVGTGIAFYLALGWGTHALLQSRPAISRRVAAVSSVAMIVIGIALLVERGATLLYG
ncbi:MAG: LysE family translocator [Microbacteriaceae bacterium]|nr:MAG: LysE family translocator [Microbacteriaceae bacterium]